MSVAIDQRRQRLARIHMGKKQLGMDEREYRAFLMQHSADDEGVGGLDSSKHMTDAQHIKVLRAMSRAGLKDERKGDNRRRFPGEPSNCNTRPLLGKVRALLTDSRKPWSYAHGLAFRMFKRKRVEWLDDTELHKLVAALQVDAKRKAQ